jgi:hypothetical protein
MRNTLAGMARSLLVLLVGAAALLAISGFIWLLDGRTWPLAVFLGVASWFAVEWKLNGEGK